MALILDRSLGEGAVGFSSGTYLAAGLADLEEMTTLNRVVADHGKIFCYHMPNQNDGLVRSGEFAAEIGRRSGVALHIAHIKASGRRNWPLMDDFLNVLTRAREDGVKVTGDLYPYAAGSSVAWSIFPPMAIEGGVDSLLRRLRDPTWRDQIRALFALDHTAGWLNLETDVGWDNAYVVAVTTSKNKPCEGQSFSSIAAARQQTPLDALMDLLIEENGQVTYLAFDGNEEHIERILREPGVMVGSDGLYGGHPHPRLYGTFARMLAVYVRERRIWTWEEAVQRMSSLPALSLGVKQRGFLRPGMFADIVVFDPVRVGDTATYRNPMSFPVGIDAVLVNGKMAFQEGKQSDDRAGTVIRL